MLLVYRQQISGQMYEKISTSVSSEVQNFEARSGIGEKLLIVYSLKVACVCPCPSRRPVPVIPILENIRQNHFCPE